MRVPVGVRFVFVIQSVFGYGCGCDRLERSTFEGSLFACSEEIMAGIQQQVRVGDEVSLQLSRWSFSRLELHAVSLSYYQFHSFFA